MSRLNVRTDQRVRLLAEALALAILVAAVLAIHVRVAGIVPSGGDGGNWLALAAELLGDGSMAAEVSYPVLLPAVVRVVQLGVEDPILALTVAALVAKVCLVLSTYLCARTLGVRLAMSAAVLVAFGGGLMEAFAWGAYPQIMAQGLGLLAVFLLLRYLGTQDTPLLVAGLVFAGLATASHLMVGALIGPALLVGVSHFVYLTGPRPAERRRDIRMALGISLPLIGLSALVAAPSAAGGLVPTINPVGLNYSESVGSIVRDAPLPWAVIAAAGIAALRIRHRPEPFASTVAVGLGWAVTSLGLFLITGEPRALLVTQVGIVLLAVFGFGALCQFLRSAWPHHHVLGTSAVLRQRLLTIFGISMIAAVVAGGIGLYGSATDWYRVVGQPEIEALDDLVEQSQGGDLVLAATGHHGNPVGWWVQGYAERPAFTAIDPAFLAFPEEIEQAEIANEFFSGDLTVDESLAVLDETGAKFVVVDRRGPDARWLESEVADEFTIVDDQSNLVVLRRSS